MNFKEFFLSSIFKIKLYTKPGRLIVLLGLFLYSLQVFSQSATDTSATQKFYPSPKKAAVYSAILPGLGQAYNGKANGWKSYWKIPVIYTAFGGLGVSLAYQQKRFRIFSDAYDVRTDGDVNTLDEYEGKYSDADLLTLKNFYNRYRDLTIIGFALVYVLNIVDANVDAHLSNFDVSPDLSFRNYPAQNYSSLCPGVRLTLKF